MSESNYRPVSTSGATTTTARPRWQEEGLSISFRSCQLTGLAVLAEALKQTAGTNGAGEVQPADVGHLDLGENELTALGELKPFHRLLSLDISHNNVEMLAQMPPSLLHLNASYNRLESAQGVAVMPGLIELNLSYNLITSCQPFEPLVQLQVLLLGGNRIGSLIGLASLARLELLDLRFNYIEKHGEVRAAAPRAQLIPSLRSVPASLCFNGPTRGTGKCDFHACMLSSRALASQSTLSHAPLRRLLPGCRPAASYTPLRTRFFSLTFRASRRLLVAAALAGLERGAPHTDPARQPRGEAAKLPRERDVDATRAAAARRHKDAAFLRPAPSRYRRQQPAVDWRFRHRLLGRYYHIGDPRQCPALQSSAHALRQRGREDGDAACVDARPGVCVQAGLAQRGAAELPHPAQRRQHRADSAQLVTASLLGSCVDAVRA